MTSKYKPFDELKKSEKLTKARAEYGDAVSNDRSFQAQARKAYNFYAGNQYTQEEKSALEAAGRPALVCNLVKPTVELIKGVNDQNRVQARAIPTEKNDGFLADILNDCYEKIRHINNIVEQEDDSLENMVTTGKGFLAVDIAPDPKRPGEIKIPVVSVPVSEVRMDQNGSWLFWEKWVTLEDFAIQYPEAIKELDDILNGESVGDLTEFGADEDFSDTFGDTPVDEDYTNILDDGFYDKTKGLIKVIHKEYWVAYDRYYGVNPQTGEIEEFSKDKLPALKKMIPGFGYQKVKDKKVKWFQFTGHKVLYDGDSPIPFDGFSIVAGYCYKDKSKARIDYFGVVKDMIDPQREADKRWSQTLNLFLKQSQGGYFVEKGAIDNVKEWADTINAPGADTVVADGAIASGKIKEKRIPQLPTGSLQLNEFAQDLLKKISGVNPDLLGMDRGRQEPGVVIKMRQQQGLILLNNLFTSHKRMINAMAERIYAIIMKYMPESQIRRILGGGKNYEFRGDLIADLKNKVVAPIRKIKDLKYNIEISDAPENLTKTMSQLSIFMEMMSKGFPVDPKTVIEKLDITEAEKAHWIEYIGQKEQSASQSAQMQMQLKQQVDQGKLQIAQGNLKLNSEKIMTSQLLEKEKLEQKELTDRRNFDIELAKLDEQGRQMIMNLVQRLSLPMQLPQ